MSSRPMTRCEGLALVEAFRGDVLVWLRLDGEAGWRAATCAMRHGSNGRSWKPRSRATSSPIFRSAINRSTALIQGTTLGSRMRKTLLESLMRGSADRAAARAG